MIKRIISRFLLSIIMLGYNSCTEKKSSASLVHINQLQVIGSHNSYKEMISPKLFEYLVDKDSTGGIYNFQYEHIPIIKQLDIGLRNLELDAYADKEGGRFAKPKGLELVDNQPDYDLEGKMYQPGFKMLHVVDLDFRSQYYLLSECLEDLRRWSVENPGHETIYITLEPKDGAINVFGTTLEPFTKEVFTDLDTTILKYLGRENIITPDDVKGSYATLEQAVLNNNWPTLEEGKGKFLFILDTKGEKREYYADGQPSLKSRVIFINAEVGTPEAAAMILNDPYDERIPNLVQKGYIIRTRADSNTKEARENDYTRFEKAKTSGAQIITTDYYLPSKLFESTYHINFGKGNFIRRNPINGEN